MNNKSLSSAAEISRLDIELEDLRDRARRGAIDMFTFQKISDKLAERKKIIVEEERKREDQKKKNSLINLGKAQALWSSAVGATQQATMNQGQVSGGGRGWIKPSKKKSKFISDLKKAGDNQKKIKEMFAFLTQTDRLRVISLDKDHKRGLQILEVEDKLNKDVYTVEVSERMSVSSDMFSSKHHWTYPMIQEEIQVTGSRRDPSVGHYNQYYQSSTGYDSNPFYTQSTIGKKVDWDLAASLYGEYQRMLTEDQKRTAKLIMESTPKGIRPSEGDIFF